MEEKEAIIGARGEGEKLRWGRGRNLVLENR